MSDGLQLRDLREGYRFVANCPCGYRAAVDPGKLMAKIEAAKFWTRRELALRLRCKRCKKHLLADIEGEPAFSIIRRRLALERPSRSTIAFQGGMLFTDKD